MREIDFVPAWYPAIERRYRWVIAQAWVTLVILVLLIAYAVTQRIKVQLASQATAQTEAQIRVSQEQLAKLTEKMKYEDQLRRQDQILAELGIGVDTTRLVKALEDAMTPEMALTNLSLETVEQARPTALALLSSRRTGDASSDVDRRLKVVIDGVAPSDVEIAALMEHLQRFGCFQNIAFPYLREARSRDGHLMREFEVTFEMDLNPPAEVRQ